MSYNKYYDSLVTKFEYTHFISNKDHATHCKDINELIGFSNYIHITMGPIFKDPNNTLKLEYEIYIKNSFLNNMLSFYESKQSTLKSLYLQALRQIRPALESYPKLIYLASDPNEILYVIAKDHVGGIRDELDIAKALDELQMKKSDLFNNSDMLKIRTRLKKSYTPEWYCRHITEKNLDLVLREFTNSISFVMHADPKSTHYVYDPIRTNKLLTMIRCYLYLNISAVTIVWENYSKEFPLEETKKFLDYMRPKIFNRDFSRFEFEIQY